MAYDLEIWKEIMTDILSNKEDKMRKKKRLNELFDKYGENKEKLEEEPGKDGIDYMFAKQYADEVLLERRANKSEVESNENLSEKDNSLLMNIVDKITPSLLDVYYEYENVKKMKISDENKHQYLSCVGAQGGDVLPILALGAMKEVRDMNKKLSSEKEKQRYGGREGVINDSKKDMINNILGASYGFNNRKRGDCRVLLKNKIK